jgi:hypothetical protein
MSTSHEILTLSLTAATAVTRRRFVTSAGAQVSAQGARALGVSDFDASVGQVFPVNVLGLVRVEAAGPIAVGDQIQASANGRAEVLAAGFRQGVCVTPAAAAGEIITFVATP